MEPKHIVLPNGDFVNQNIEPISTFKAVFNPITKVLAVKYGDFTKVHQFEDLSEWTAIDYNGNNSSFNYLHIQLDYDVTLQLIFYPRLQLPVDHIENSNLNEDLATVWHSGMTEQHIPENVRIVYNDLDWLWETRVFLGWAVDDNIKSWDLERSLSADYGFIPKGTVVRVLIDNGSYCVWEHENLVRKTPSHFINFF